MRKHSPVGGDSVAYIGGLIDVNDIAYVAATLNPGKEKIPRYTVTIVTDSEIRTVENVIEENVTAIGQIVAQFRSPSLPGIAFSVDGKTTTITGLGGLSAGRHRRRTVPA